MGKLYNINVKKIFEFNVEIVATDLEDAKRQVVEMENASFVEDRAIGDPEYIYEITEKIDGKVKKPDWMNRIPTNRKLGVVNDGVTTGKLYTELEKRIMAYTHTQKLTEAQRDKLDKDVIVYVPVEHSKMAEPQLFPSPNEMFEESGLFKTFAESKAKAMASHGATNGKIIDAIARYETPQGWLAYQKLHQIRVEAPVSEDKAQNIVDGNAGYSPSIKRVTIDTIEENDDPVG